MDLRFILNPADDNPAPVSNDDAPSEESTEVEDNITQDINTPPRHHYHGLTPPSTTSRRPSPAKRPRLLPTEILTPTQNPLPTGHDPALRPPTTPFGRLNFEEQQQQQPQTPTPPSKPLFNIFTSLLQHPSILLEFARLLPLPTLISLYSISKPFHHLISLRLTSLLTTLSRTHAPESASTFIWRCYKSLCIKDPAFRPNESRPGQLRWIPSFKWLKMIYWREEVVDDILRMMAREGHRFPRRMSWVLKKVWFTMDISDNGRRIGLIHNEGFWGKKDLFLATMFFIKLDMRMTCPVTGNGEVGMRKMILGMRSLSFLRGVLRREELRDSLEVLRMIVRYEGKRPEGGAEGESVLGVPAEEVGMLQYEGWGVGGSRKKLMGVCDLVMREAFKRKLGLQRFYMDMMVYGYINKKSFEDIIRKPPPPVEQPVAAEEGDNKIEQDSEEEEGSLGDDDMEDDEDEDDMEDVVMVDEPTTAVPPPRFVFRGGRRPQLRPRQP